MLEIRDQKVLKDLVSRSNLQKHIVEQSEYLIWDEILIQFNIATQNNLSIEDIREEWTHIYETIGYTSGYSSSENEEDSSNYLSFQKDHEYLRSPHKK